MSSIFSKIEPKVLISTAASAAATTMLVRSVARDLIPDELRLYLRTKFHQFVTSSSTEMTVVIDEIEGLKKNHLFFAAELYVAKIFSPSTKGYRASIPEKETKIQVSLGENEEIIDTFCGIQLKWKLVAEKSSRRYAPYPDECDYTSTISHVRYLKLTFHKKHKDKIIDEYLPHVVERSKALKEEKKIVKLHTLKRDWGHGPKINAWDSVNLDHPANFETLAMDDEVKSMIVDDLDRFLNRRELYQKVGKAWKRGYLLFGPPGTGKSSLIAAMANYLKFDVYDLELPSVLSNSDLRRLLISTANRSILVVEDIDASIDLAERRNKEYAAVANLLPPPSRSRLPKVALSGLLNFIDGLWSSCGDERIIIFTTNHKERLDPALLRPGRMDVHIHMSYCTPRGFRLLAGNYLGLGMSEHRLMPEAEELIASSKVTPAEVCEQLLKCDDPELALASLIDFLRLKKESEDEVEAEDKKRKTPDALKELIKLAKALPAEECEKILKNNVAAHALKFLIGSLQQENGTGNTNASESSSSGIKAV